MRLGGMWSAVDDEKFSQLFCYKFGYWNKIYKFSGETMLLKLNLFVLLIQTGLSLPSKGEPTISECVARGGECDESKGRPVCGTDNQTYPTRCHLIRAQCSGHQVSLKHRGTCKDVCLASRSYALSHRASSPYVKFVPRCRDDGTYAPVQCSDGVGCWCVNSQGKPLPNTTVKNGKPVCIKKGKSNQRRSSPRNPIRNKRSCSRVDRVLFNTNLLKLFQNEHVRHYSQNLKSNSAVSITDKMVLDWKFYTMDVNKNHMLDKNEYRELKRIIKKVVKPKRCGRAFGKSCDHDQDERLSRQEWSNCLSKENLNPDTNFSSSSGASGYLNTANGIIRGGVGGNSFMRLDDSQNISQDFDDFDDEDDYIDNDDDSDELPDSDNTLLNGLPFSTADSRYQPGFLLQGKSTLELKGEDPILRENEGESDCLSDRNAALDEQKAGTTALYVPECTADGRYQRVQCYRSTGYCWCVHEDTGKNIPGTSTKDKRPQCDSLAPSTRPMKGCPDDKKLEFLKDLKDFLKNQVSSSSAIGRADSTKWATEDEKIATLSFVLLDKNKNSVWERKEWKTFRELVTASRQLRKCGKKMPRYCDVNSDRKITLSEWLNCLHAQRNPSTEALVQQNVTVETRPSPVQLKFKGPNPLESYLKSD